MFVLWSALGFVSSTVGQPPVPATPPQEIPAAETAAGETAAANATPTPAAAVDATAPAVKQSYVGSKQCFVCHRPQTNVWSESSHALAFQHLPEQYRQDSACLKCHVTAFGEPDGFVAGTEKDLSMVGCESCHGPGALHIDAAQRFVLATTDEAKIEKEMRDTIVKTPADSVCTGCHATQAHGSHPAYQSTLPAPSAIGAAPVSSPRPIVSHGVVHVTRSTLYSPGYNVKTCGSCHYDQYLHWRAEKHSALSMMVPTKYRNDQSCQACHPGFHMVASSAVNIASSQNRIGVACESCHGASLEHVRFNVQFIHGPRLGPKLEQAARQSIRKNKPATTCVQCHLEQNHKAHPPYDKD